jgi:hypothetical protein
MAIISTLHCRLIHQSLFVLYSVSSVVRLVTASHPCFVGFSAAKVVRALFCWNCFVGIALLELLCWNWRCCQSREAVLVSKSAARVNMAGECQRKRLKRAWVAVSAEEGDQSPLLASASSTPSSASIPAASVLDATKPLANNPTTSNPMASVPVASVSATSDPAVSTPVANIAAASPPSTSVLAATPTKANTTTTGAADVINLTGLCDDELVARIIKRAPLVLGLNKAVYDKEFFHNVSGLCGKGLAWVQSQMLTHSASHGTNFFRQSRAVKPIGYS